MSCIFQTWALVPINERGELRSSLTSPPPLPFLSSISREPQEAAAAACLSSPHAAAVKSFKLREPCVARYIYVRGAQLVYFSPRMRCWRRAPMYMYRTAIGLGSHESWRSEAEANVPYVYHIRVHIVLLFFTYIYIQGRSWAGPAAKATPWADVSFLTYVLFAIVFAVVKWGLYLRPWPAALGPSSPLHIYKVHTNTHCFGRRWQAHK
jgi:hypothetical protein